MLKSGLTRRGCVILQESLEDVKKRKDKLEVELLEARALSVSATRNVERLERYEGEGASEDEEEGELSSFVS